MNDIKKINIKGIIKQKLEKTDKNGNEYLILKVEDEERNEETIFIFSSKIDVERWAQLKEEDKEYNFTVEEGNNGSNLLIDFEIET
jgi:hypothetical protein